MTNLDGTNEIGTMDTFPQSVSSSSPKLLGSLDLISDEGIVYGWAWDQEKPSERVEVEFLIDGVSAGTTVVGHYREDLLTAGIGDGYYGFSWPLPYDVLAQPRDVTLSARIKNNETLLSPLNCSVRSRLVTRSKKSKRLSMM